MSQQKKQATLATLITIGDEILIGQTVDTNSTFMSRQLNSIGIKVHEIISISDDAQHIKSALDTALKTADIVLITGGLGATKDDITKNTLADYFGSKLVMHQDILADIEAYFKQRGRPILESVRSLAMLPEKCEVIQNLKGTAAAMYFEEKGKVIVSMPGVPYEMKDFMTRIIIPRFQERFETPILIHRQIMCSGLGESTIADKIKEVESALPKYIKLAFLPTVGIVKLRLTATGTDEKALRKEVESFADAIKAILYPKYAYADGSQALEEAVGDLLVAQNAVVGLAESCTGGEVARRFVANAGSSRYFKGGVVAYDNDLKINLLGVQSATLEVHGAVSEPCVQEMAKGALERLKVDYALAISGVAGPSGGTAEKPVGTVWMAAAAKNGTVVSKKITLARNRQLNIDLAATLAVSFLRLLILENAQ